jgi:predicted ATPase
MLDYPYFLALLANVCSRAGQFDQSFIAVAGAQAMVLNSRAFYYEAELHRLKGLLLLHENPRRDVVEAQARFEQALAVARRQQAKSLELRAAMSLGRLWHQQGRTDDAHHLLDDTYGWFREGFDTADLRKARALLQAWNDRPTTNDQRLLTTDQRQTFADD